MIAQAIISYTFLIAMSPVAIVIVATLALVKMIPVDPDEHIEER